MNGNQVWQSLLTGALLLLVGAAFGAIAVKLSTPQESVAARGAVGEAMPAAHAESSQPRPLSDGVLVYFFHGRIRCQTCLEIEATAKEAIEKYFGDALRLGRVVVREINYDQPENKHFIEKYHIIAPTVVLVQIRDGQEVRFENLMDVWQLVGDKPKFHEYIARNLRELLGVNSG